nr:PREDICTED: photosynthetic NDH subunit of lumenal location 3, chloroplastic-like [Raphanus sativus]
MAHFLDLNTLTTTCTLPSIPKLLERSRTGKSSGFVCKKTDNVQEQQQLTRRMALGFAVSISLTGAFGQSNVSLAQDNNGFWIDGPLPTPPIYNNIVNEQTGTRTFLKKGVYVADIGAKGRTYRVKKYAFDLLAMEDLIGPDTLNYVKKYLRLKSTFLFYDFDNLISVAASQDNDSSSKQKHHQLGATSEDHHHHHRSFLGIDLNEIPTGTSDYEHVVVEVVRSIHDYPDPAPVLKSTLFFGKYICFWY